MEQKFTRNNTLFSGAILLLGILGILLSLTGCKTIDIKNKADLLPYMNKPVAFMPVKPQKNLEKVWPQMMGLIEQRLRELPTLDKVTGIKERKLKFVKNPKLRSQFQTYLSTLSLTGISDKEIAWKLKKELESPYFLLLDLASFPCTKDCSANEQWVIRLKLIEAHSGDLIFLARIQHELSKDEKSVE